MKIDSIISKREMMEYQAREESRGAKDDRIEDWTCNPVASLINMLLL